MRLSILAPLALLSVTTGCASPNTLPLSSPSGLRVVNAFTGPVDISIDGTVVVQGLAAGSIDTITPTAGDHTVILRPTGPGLATTQSVTTSAGALSTVAAVLSSSGAIASVALDDTNNVVPSGATKVRVIHFAPNAGVLQVYRTQPDFQHPIQWQFPFVYQSNPTSLSAPFYQSTVGSWEVRVWQTPADSSGWAAATTTVTIPLASGEKKTVLLLDKVGGGVRIEVL